MRAEKNRMKIKVEDGNCMYLAFAHHHDFYNSYASIQKRLKKTKMNLPDNFYLKPWHSDDTDLTVQLHREINKNHILYGKPVKTIARRQDNDDVLFEVDSADFKYSMVHLTWSQKILDDSRYPRTETYKNWEEVYKNRIIIDHQGWENE